MKKTLLLISLSFIFSNFIFAQGFIWDEDIQKQYEEIDLIETNSRAILPASSSVERYTPKFSWSQGNTNLCVAYALAYARTTLYNYNKRITSEKDQVRNTFSPGFIYWCAIPEGMDCLDPGLNPVTALKVLLNYGAAPLSSVEYPSYYPFEDARICYRYPLSFKDDFAEASLYKLDKVKRVTNVSEVKSALSNGSPCLYGIKVVSSFSDALGKDVWTPYSSESPNNTDGNHALAVIAYDDYKYGGAFKIFNSWGSSWGNNGAIWIKYDDFLEYGIAVFSLHRRYESSSFGSPSPDALSLPKGINLPNFSNKSDLVEEEVDYLDIELFNEE